MWEKAEGHSVRGRRIPGLFIAGVLALLLLATSTLGPGPTHGAPPDPTPTPFAGGLVRIPYEDRAQVSAWVRQGLDIWEVHPRHVVAWVTGPQHDQLRARGLSVEVLPQDRIGPRGTPSYPSCYRTYAQMRDFLLDTATQHPTLTTLLDVGDGWEKAQGLADRDLWVLRITSQAVPGPKPRLLIVAEHHARELIAPEVAMNFIEHLTRHYGVDPEVTWLVDDREIWVMPMANPDGHIKAENRLNWRKNTDDANGCLEGDPPNFYGVDLNRNYAHQWGGEGASDDPCSLVYQGPTPFSEPETRAIRDLVVTQGFDLLMDLHSYGDLILYPWSYTEDPAPDQAHLHAIAAKLASYNDYKAQQGAALYLASGDAMDWAYGERGIPAFTFEIGSRDDGGFWPPCDRVDELWRENLQPLLYAAKIAEAPYRQVYGPDALELTLSRSLPITLEATISDVHNGGQAIASAQYFVDALGPEGAGRPMSPVDGDFDASVEQVRAILDLTGLGPGRHLIYVMGQDGDGHWGPPSAIFLELSPTPTATPPPTSTPTATPRPTPTPPWFRVYLPLSRRD